MVLGETEFAFFVAFSNGKSSPQRLPIPWPKGLQKSSFFHMPLLLHSQAWFYDDSWSNSEDFLKKTLGQLEHFTRGAAQGHSQALTLFLGIHF